MDPTSAGKTAFRPDGAPQVPGRDVETGNPFPLECGACYLDRDMAKLGLQVLVPFLLCVSGFLDAQDLVTTTDGRRIRGAVSEEEDAVLVRGALADTYLSPAVVRTTEPAADQEPLVTFTFHLELLARRIKGKVGAVPENVVWGQWSREGLYPVTLTDPKLARSSALERHDRQDIFLGVIEVTVRGR